MKYAEIKIKNEDNTINIINTKITDSQYNMLRCSPALPKIKNIDFQPPLTVVVWNDGTKTFVKCDEDESFDPEKGAAMAIAKKAMGNKYNFIDNISYYVDKYNKKHPKEA